MKIVKTGVSRNVILTERYAIKYPKPVFFWPFIRGWLANQSEWRQRKRRRVARPVFTLFHFFVWYPRAKYIGLWPSWDAPDFTYGMSEEERKGSSWGNFSFHEWKLIDFDRAWENPRGVIGRVYYWRQERLGRKWSKL